MEIHSGSPGESQKAERERDTQLRGDEAQEGKKQRREETGDHLMFLLKEIQSFLERT